MQVIIRNRITKDAKNVRDPVSCYFRRERVIVNLASDNDVLLFSSLLSQYRISKETYYKECKDL